MNDPMINEFDANRHRLRREFAARLLDMLDRNTPDHADEAVNTVLNVSRKVGAATIECGEILMDEILAKHENFVLTKVAQELAKA